MTDDPDDPAYRYPQPGERFWHIHKEQWVTVVTDERVAERDLSVLGEVRVLGDDGKPAIVKLHNLEDQPPA